MSSSTILSEILAERGGGNHLRYACMTIAQIG